MNHNPSTKYALVDVRNKILLRCIVRLQSQNLSIVLLGLHQLFELALQVTLLATLSTLHILTYDEDVNDVDNLRRCSQENKAFPVVYSINNFCFIFSWISKLTKSFKPSFSMIPPNITMCEIVGHHNKVMTWSSSKRSIPTIASWSINNIKAFKWLAIVSSSLIFKERSFCLKNTFFPTFSFKEFAKCQPNAFCCFSFATRVTPNLSSSTW